MAKRQAKLLKSPDIQGLKYLERLLPLLDRRHEVGCQRDKAGHRSRHNVPRKRGSAHAALGSLSEAVELVDPQRLCGIIESLVAEVKPVPDVRRGHTAQILTAVDGSVVKTLQSIVEAAFRNDKNGGSQSGWRFPTHFDVDRHVPTRIEVSPGSNGCPSPAFKW